MEVLEFLDTKTRPDIVHTYTPAHKNNSVPIVIDNGSYLCKVGWSSDAEPLLQFRNLIAKPRRERSKKDTVEIPQIPQLQVGNDIVNIEAVRFQLKTQFDRNVVTHFEAQEHLFDYAFSHLGIDTEDEMPHPILCTEAVLNPNSSRQLMSELLFECYNVPSLCYAVDALLSHHYHTNSPKDALIINLGYQTCHIIPLINNKTIFENIRRLNTGGFHIINFVHRLLQLKYPVHANAITVSRAEELVHNLCKIAKDYREELAKWSNVEYYDTNVKKIQLPFTASVAASAVTLEQQKERKKELARRLIEINARKREERLAEDEEKLSQLLDIKDMIELGANPEIIERTLMDYQIKSVSDLEKNILLLNAKIEKTRQKILSASLSASTNIEEQEETPPKQAKYSKLVFGSDKEQHIFMQNIRKMRQEILTKKMIRKQRKQDMAKRRTAAGQERMRLISQLARKEKGNDDFGMRDEDWDIYKTISKDGGDSDSETENEKLLEFDEILRTHEPTEMGESSQPGEAHQLHFGVEMIRGPELLFKPYMFGSQEAGLSEIIGYVLSLFDVENQSKLVSNVIVTGGLARLPGLKERLLADLVSIRPFKSKVNVSIMNDCGLSSWYGARNFSRTDEFRSSLVTKQMYQEFGADYFQEHKSSNPYYPSPSSGSDNGSVVEVDGIDL